MIPFSRPCLNWEETYAVREVLESGQISPGDQVTRFQEEFCDYVNVRYGFFTNSGTSALKMAYKYYKLKGHRSFDCTINTYPATYFAGEEVGLVRMKGSGLYTSVHYGGIRNDEPCLIEDSAQRIEKDDPLSGEIRCYSFYATKNMTTGQGGMVCTNDSEVASFLRIFQNDGYVSRTEPPVTPSGGYDGTDISAAIGRVQLRKLPEFTRRRNEIRDKYNDELGNDWRGNHLYVHFVDDVDRFRARLEGEGVQTGYHYPGTGWRGVSLPIYPLLEDKQVKYICKVIRGMD